MVSKEVLKAFKELKDKFDKKFHEIFALYAHSGFVLYSSCYYDTGIGVPLDYLGFVCEIRALWWPKCH